MIYLELKTNRVDKIEQISHTDVLRTCLMREIEGERKLRMKIRNAIFLSYFKLYLTHCGCSALYQSSKRVEKSESGGESERG